MKLPLDVNVNNDQDKLHLNMIYLVALSKAFHPRDAEGTAIGVPKLNPRRYGMFLWLDFQQFALALSTKVNGFSP